MYESPIILPSVKFHTNPQESKIHQAIKETCVNVAESFDKYILSAVVEQGITVNMEELIKALRYDRDQYSKGYHDAEVQYRRIGGEWTWEGNSWLEKGIVNYEWWECSACGRMVTFYNDHRNDYKFCPYCGAEMENYEEED